MRTAPLLGTLDPAGTTGRRISAEREERRRATGTLRNPIALATIGDATQPMERVVSDTEQHSLDARTAAVETLLTVTLERLFCAGALDKAAFLHDADRVVTGFEGEDRRAAEAAALRALINRQP